MIYFIGNKALNICKIGYSDRPYRRIKNISETSPIELEIFDIIDGDIQKEQMILASHSQHRIKGEWFHLDKIEELGLTGGIYTFFFEGFNIHYDVESGFIYYPSVIAFINKIIVSSGVGKRKITISSYRKGNKEFLDSIGNWLVKDKFIDPRVFIDMFCYGGAVTKLFIMGKSIDIPNHLELLKNIRDKLK